MHACRMMELVWEMRVPKSDTPVRKRKTQKTCKMRVGVESA